MNDLIESNSCRQKAWQYMNLAAFKRVPYPPPLRFRFEFSRLAGVEFSTVFRLKCQCRLFYLTVASSRVTSGVDYFLERSKGSALFIAIYRGMGAGWQLLKGQ